MNIALVVPSGVGGGVATIAYSLHRDLANDGIHVNLIKLEGKKLPLFSAPLFSAMYNDILKMKYLREHDLVLFMGSIPWPSHIPIKLLGTPVVLFLHGFVYHELAHAIFHQTKLEDKVGAGILMTMLKTATSLGTISLYVCHSLTACECNNITRNFVILPQWLSRDELEYFCQYQRTLRTVETGRGVRIVAYTSHAASPRLLNEGHLIALAKFIKRNCNREFELIIVSPNKKKHSIGSVKIIKPMQREEFISLLASADLFIERSTDEELGISSLEAMAIGIPVAKLTHQRYWDRQDYKEDDLILASSFKELAYKISEYVNNLEHYRYYYLKRSREFVSTKRVWNVVKKPFLTALNRLVYR